MEKKYSKKVVKMVTEQVINMWENNVLRDCGCEGFVGWCEDGDVFEGNEDEVKDATELMELVAPQVDNITYGFLNTDGFGYCEENS